MELYQTDRELLVASNAYSRVSENWILDSGCTFHMTPNWGWFSTCKHVHKGAVLMGNNAYCNVTPHSRGSVDNPSTRGILVNVG